MINPEYFGEFPPEEKTKNIISFVKPSRAQVPNTRLVTEAINSRLIETQMTSLRNSLLGFTRQIRSVYGKG